MKRILSILIIIMLSISLVACSSTSVDVAKIDKEETYPNGMGSLADVYTDFDDLTDATVYIVEVDVQETEVQISGEIPLTHSKVKILDVQKGDLNVGDVIEIVELGGITPDKGEAIAGVPALRKSQRLVLFMVKNDDKYLIRCNGKFIEREGFLFQQATEETKVKEYKPKEVKDFKNYVKKSIDRLEKNKSDK